MKAAPTKPKDMNGEISHLWDFIAHTNSRIDNIYKWGFLAVVAIIANQWGATVVLKAIGVTE